MLKIANRQSIRVLSSAGLGRFRTKIARGSTLKPLILSTLLDRETPLGYPAKPVSNRDFRHFVELVSKAAILSTNTSIGNELFQKLTKEQKYSQIILCDFLGTRKPMAALDPLSGKIYINADCLRSKQTFLESAILAQFTRMDIHEHVHFLQYSTKVKLGIESTITNKYPEFTRIGALQSPHFAHRLLSEIYAHFLEKMHLYELNKGKKMTLLANNLFNQLIDNGLEEEAFLRVVHSLITHQGYDFDTPFLSKIYSVGFTNSQSDSLYRKQLDGAKSVLKNFGRVYEISQSNPQLQQHEHAFLYEPDDHRDEWGSESFSDIISPMNNT